MESSPQTGIGRYYAGKSVHNRPKGKKEKRERRRERERETDRSVHRCITDDDDILQPIIAYVEIRDLQHNGRRAARFRVSPFLRVPLRRDSVSSRARALGPFP